MKFRRQHYIPQFLINRFKDQNNDLSVYLIKVGKLLKNQNSINFAQIRDMYNLSESDLREVLSNFTDIYPHIANRINFDDPMFIEKYFSRVENNVSDLIDRILKHDYLFLTTLDKLILISFFHDLSYRTKFYRDFRRALTTKSNQIIEDIGKANKLDEAIYKNSFLDTTSKVEMATIFDVSSLVNFVAMIFTDYYFCYAINDSHLDFILSDNPCLQLAAGINDFCFPISSRRAVVLRHNKSYKNRICSIPNFTYVMHLDDKNVMEYNIFNAENSHEAIFGSYQSVRLMSEINPFKYFTVD